MNMKKFASALIAFLWGLRQGGALLIIQTGDDALKHRLRNLLIANRHHDRVCRRGLGPH